MHKYIVKGVEKLSPTSALISLHSSEHDGLFSFQPGQYAAISFKRRGRPTPARCFSIVSSPTEQHVLQFGLRVKGRYTTAINKVQPGDEVKVRGPFGGFVFDQERDKDVYFFAGGIGISPFISMLRFATSNNLDNKITLLYSAQTQDDVPFFDELKQIQLKNKNVKIVYVIGEGPTNKLGNNQEILQGRVTDEIIKKYTLDKYTNKTFFICGPPPYMKALLNILKTKDVAKNRIITEAFSQGPNRQTGKINSWPINMYILTGAGVVLAFIAVTVSDLMKILPPSKYIGPGGILRQKTLQSNSRATDIDVLVNSLPPKDSNSPPSYAVKQSQKEKAAQTSQAPTSSSSSSSSSSQKSTSSTKTPTTTTTPPKTAPPAPKCTTSQSGVTTCL